MKGLYVTKRNGFLLMVTLMMAVSSYGQMQIHVASGFGTSFKDVNDSGLALTGGQYFDFTNQTWIPLEPEAAGLASINNNGDVAGDMFYDEENFIYQPAYRQDGVWYPIGWFDEAEPSESSYITYAISPNGRYVTGQMSIGCCDFGTFLFDTETQTMSSVFSDDYVAVTGYTVNNDGVIGGWADDEEGGSTHRIPVYITLDMVIHHVSDVSPSSWVNSVNEINGNNVMVGEFDQQPFIYDMNSDEFTTYSIPDEFESATFISISDNGVATGYAQRGGMFGNPEREAIIYHPVLGNDPVFIKDILEDNGLTFQSDDNMLGTGYAISPDGNYLVGYFNGGFFANGWIIYFDDLLLVEPACTFDCPEDIIIDLAFGETTAVAEYEINYTCGENAPDEVVLSLESGLPSGSEFPVGVNTVIHRLHDGEGNLITSCSFDVIVNDTYCVGESLAQIEPITRVAIADLDHTSSANPLSTNFQEFFLDQVINVGPGNTYEITLEGYTGGNFENFFTVFADWNQDGEYTANETYEIGSISNSSGVDGIQAIGDVTVPADAMLGETRFRVLKQYGFSATTPCNDVDYGQIEEYTINVDESLDVFDFDTVSLSYYPNPVKGDLNISADIIIESMSVYNITGQKVAQISLNSSQAVIDLSSLDKGVYAITMFSGNQEKTFKIVKD